MFRNSTVESYGRDGEIGKIGRVLRGLLKDETHLKNRRRVRTRAAEISDDLREWIILVGEAFAHYASHLTDEPRDRDAIINRYAEGKNIRHSTDQMFRLGTIAVCNWCSDDPVCFS